MPTRPRVRLLAAVVALVSSIPALVGIAPAQASTVPGTWVGLPQARVLDTGTGIGVPKAVVGPHATVTVQITGRGGVPATGAGSVALNLIVASPSAAGSVVAYPAGVARPATSSVTFAPHQTIANLTVTRLGTHGRISIYNGSNGTVRLMGDVSGFYRSGTPTAAGSFASVSQVRVLDTGTGIGVSKMAVSSHATITVQIAGRGGVPTSGAGSVALNLDVVSPSAAGTVTTWAAGSARPSSASLAFSAHQSVAQLTFTRLGSGGRISIYNGSNGTVRLVADVSGWFRAGTSSASGALVPVTQTRVLDTMHGKGAATPAGGAVASIQVAGVGGVPLTGAGSVAVYVTAIAPSAAGTLTAYGDGQGRPRTTGLLSVAGRSVSNLFVVPLGVDGSIDLYNASSGATPLAADVVGYFRGSNPVASCTGFTNTTGISNSTIHLANAADISGPVPGLFRSAQEATQAYAAYFNSTSRICGRTLTVDAIDSQTSSAGDQQAATTACASDFAMVGSMSAFDDGGAQTAQNCGIPDLRVQPSTAARKDASNTLGAAYAESGQVSNVVPTYFLQTAPAAAAHAAMVYLNAGSFSTLAQSEQAGWQKLGFTFVYSQGVDVTELSYDTYVIAMISHGVQYVQFVGSYQSAIKLKKSMVAHSFNPVFMVDPVAYDPGYITYGGSDVDGTYSFDDSAFLQSQSANPELQRYEYWLQKVSPGATPTRFGLLAWSSAGLFAAEAQALGGTLTRANLIAALKRIHGLTGNGLTSPQDLADRTAPPCTSVIQVSNGAWVRRTTAPYVCGPLTSTGVG